MTASSQTTSEYIKGQKLHWRRIILL